MRKKVLSSFTMDVGDIPSQRPTDPLVQKVKEVDRSKRLELLAAYLTLVASVNLSLGYPVMLIIYCIVCLKDLNKTVDVKSVMNLAEDFEESSGPDCLDSLKHSDEERELRDRTLSLLPAQYRPAVTGVNNNPPDPRGQTGDSSTNVGSGSSTNTNIASGNSTNTKIGSGNSTNTNSASGNSTNTNSASGNSTNYNIASGNSTNTNSASGNSTNTNSASGNSTNYNIASGNSTNTNIASGNSTNTNSASGNSTNTNSASGNSTNYNIASGNSTNTNIASGNSTNTNIACGNCTNTDIASGNSTNTNSPEQTGLLIPFTRPDSGTTSRNSLSHEIANGFINSNSSLKPSNDTYAQTCLAALERRFMAVKNENNLLEKNMRCVHCGQNPRGVTFLPCGHFITCKSCSGPVHACNLCNKNILATVDTYLS
ncbi:uncharacterized PPE family protein PPE12-like [Physella acuta]|uniref:uncharacterized PPE family protein PPE12-like n=1 Tax=Physella acuta TaxID=109671 RepID=UPI0027DC4D8F|nr:uncharacterized PPE family protein PPE12-like [Physella acuta]